MKPRILILLLCYAICITTACKKEADESANTLNSSTVDNAQSSATDELKLNPNIFVHGINNPYFPLVPGTIFHFVNTIEEHGEKSKEHETETVTSDIKKIVGVKCEVVHDVIKEDGEITEDTYDWYAQDTFGNVWYFGEDTKELTDTGWSTAGSWEAGVNNAVPGIIMFGDPELFIGQTFYEEFSPGVAEDQATLLNVTATATVPYGHFTNCVKTKEFTRLEPGDIERKFYAKGIGQVLGVSADERDELVSVKKN
jgi:hypothetical protein